MLLKTGQRMALSDLIGNSLNFQLKVKFNADFPVDISLFGVNSVDKLYADEYMVFYGNPISPKGVVKLSQEGGQNVFSFDLGLHTENIVEKFILCATVDHPSKTMKEIRSGSVDLIHNNNVIASFNVTPESFQSEKAVMLTNIYFKNVWRFGTIGQGFNGGLPALIRYFGGEVEEVPVPPKTSKLDLKKKVILDKVGQQSPQLIDLTKKSLISLEKKKLLEVKARIGLVLDRSGSMHNQYKNGDVQKVIDRVLPLAVSFDDDGSFECWAFGQKTVRLHDVSMSNVANYIENTDKGWKKWKIGFASNYEPQAIEEVINYYSNFNDGIPTYIVFISDGGIYEDAKITKLITKASSLPIFWQFIGIGGSSYGILEKLDSMGGRIIDNCNFFSLDKIDQYPDEKLYDLLLNEFPQWLIEAKQKQIVRD